MEEVRRISKNTGALVAAKVISSGLVFLLAILINRELGPERAGIYTYAFVLYTIFQVIPDFGLGNISVRDVSRDLKRMRFFFGNVVSLRLLLGLAALALLMLTNLVTWALQSGDPYAGEKFWAVFALSFCLLLEQPFSNSLAENFIALQRLTVIALVYLVMGALRMALSSVVILRGDSPALVLLMLVYLVSVVYTIVHFWLLYRRWLKREAPEQVEGFIPAGGSGGDAAPGREAAEAAGAAEVTLVEAPDDLGVTPLPKLEQAAEPGAPAGEIAGGRGLQGYLLRSAWPLALAAVGITVYAGLDVPLLSWMRGNEDVGLYNAAAMYAKAFVFLTLAVNMALLPALSRMGTGDRGRLGETWEKLMRYAVVLVLPMAVVVPLLARPVLILQGTDQWQYVQAWPVVWLSMAAMVFTFMTAVSFPFFVVIDRQRALTRIIFTGLALKVALNLVFIPLWGYQGSGICLVVSEVFMFALYYLGLRRELGHRISFVRFFAFPAAALGLMYAVALLLEQALVSGKTFAHEVLDSLGYAALIALVVMVLYAGLAWVTRAIDRSGLQRLNSLLQAGKDLAEDVSEKDESEE